MAAAKGKTKCQLCGASLWNYHVKRHMTQYHFHGSMNHPPRPPRFEDEESNENQCSLSEYGEMSEDGSNGHEEEDDYSAEDGMFDDERALSLETYIEGLSDYNPKRVLKYLNWTKRQLTPIEQEVVRFLRSISFGGGLSAAHTKEMLDYVRGLGGMHRSITTRCTRMMYVHYDVH